MYLVQQKHIPILRNVIALALKIVGDVNLLESTVST